MIDMVVKVSIPGSMNYCKHPNGELCRFTKGVTELRCVLFEKGLGMVKKRNKYFILKCKECMLHNVL